MKDYLRRIQYLCNISSILINLFNINLFILRGLNIVISFRNYENSKFVNSNKYEFICLRGN